MISPRSDWESMGVAEIEAVFEKRLSASKESARKSMSGAFDASGWLALAPFGTLSMARAAGESGLEKALADLRAQGLVEVSPVEEIDDDTPEPVYSMTTGGRAAVIDHFTQERGGARRLRGKVEDFARGASKSSTTLPPPIDRWSQLASHATDGAAFARAFEARVDQAFRDRNAGELLNWIEAARPLVDLATRDLDDAPRLAIERAGRRLELLNRRTEDERHLLSFLPREEQIRALEDLLRGPDTLWALHLFGVGGVGKTMLLRYLTGHLAPEQFKAPTARIDFDYLNPDYPRLDPGLLLWSFAQELRAYDVNGLATEKFDAADEKLQVLNQQLAAHRGPQGQRATDHPIFIDALAVYIDALRVLPQPVVLIVDTCEELAKMRADGSVPENVEETFRILRAIHDGPLTLQGREGGPQGLASLRVVFAGRRPLASAGHGWTCESSRQPARPYLRLHDVRGFTHPEAETYLKSKVQIPESLVQPVIDRSPDIGGGSSIAWRDGSHPALDVERCNPYDLRLYADWAREKPPPAPEIIRASSPAQYVELRILRRIEAYASLRRVLPLVARLKFFDLPLLRAVLQDDAEADKVIDRLSQQEWVDARRVIALDGTSRMVFGVEEGLRRRLWAYFRERGEVDQEMLRRACTHLEGLTLHADSLRRIDWTAYDTAVRAFEYEPARGARWWKQAEELIISERGHDWLLQVTSALLAPKNSAEARDGLDGQPETPMRAAIMAAFLSASLHEGSPASVEVTWQHVLLASGKHPDEGGRRLLEIRAVAGQVAMAASTSADPADLSAAARMISAPRFEQLAPGDQPQAAAALIAMQEALLELVDRSGGSESPAWSWLSQHMDAPYGPASCARLLMDLVPGWAQLSATSAAESEALLAFSCGLAARACALAGDYEGASEWFDKALAHAGSPETSAPAVAWRDWRAPENLYARLRIEYGLAMYPARDSAQATLKKLGTFSFAKAANIDEERFDSLQMQLLEATGASLPQVAGSGTMGEPRCHAHRAIAPMFVAISLHRAGLGEITKSIDALRQASAMTSNVPLDILRHSTRALARLILRLRLSDLGERASTTLTQSPLPDDRGLAWQIGVHGGEPPPLDSAIPEDIVDDRMRDRWRHALWQASPGLVEDRVRSLVAWAQRNLRIEPGGRVARHFVEASLVLDGREAGTLAQALEPSLWPDLTPYTVDARDYWRREPHRPLETLILILRARALGLVSPDDLIDKLAAHLGYVRAADVAFSLGESLMLRLPGMASLLFARARTWYITCNRPVSAFLASLRMANTAAGANESAFEFARKGMLELYAQLPLQHGLRVEAPAQADLPSLLATIAEDPTRSLAWLREQRVPEWLPTLQRLLACMHPAAEVWPIQFVPGYSAGALGIDFMILWHMAGPQARKESTGQPLATRVRKTVVQILGTAFGVAFLIGGLWMAITALTVGFGYFGRGLEQFRVTAGLGTGARLALYAGLLLILGAGLPALVTAMRRRLASSTLATVTILPAARADGYRSRVLEETVHISLQVSTPRLILPFGIRFAPGDVINAESTTGGLSPYLEAAQKIDARVTEALRKASKPASPRSIDVIITAPPEIHGPCWEGMLQLAAIPAPTSWPALRCMRIVEVTRPVARTNAAHGSSRKVMVSVSGEPNLHPVLQNAVQIFLMKGSPRQPWKVIPTGPAQVADAGVTGGLSVSSGGLDAPVVLHLLGRIDEDVEGLGFAAGRRESARTRKAGSEDALLRPDQVARAFPHMTLLMLQPEPLQGPVAERLNSDREDAARMRSFAAQVCTYGVPWILVLPRLDSALSTWVLERMALQLRAIVTPHQRALRECAADIQRHIIDNSDKSAVAIEAALDVTLFSATSQQKT